MMRVGTYEYTSCASSSSSSWAFRRLLLTRHARVITSPNLRYASYTMPCPFKCRLPWSEVTPVMPLEYMLMHPSVYLGSSYSQPYSSRQGRKKKRRRQSNNSSIVCSLGTVAQRRLKALSTRRNRPSNPMFRARHISHFTLTSKQTNPPLGSNSCWAALTQARAKRSIGKLTYVRVR